MTKIGFDVPPSVDDIITLLNRSTKWQITLVDTAGTVHGHYLADYGRTQDGLGGYALIYNGDIDSDNGHPLFTSETDEAAVVFLHGVFLGQFGARRVEDIQDEVMRKSAVLI